MRVLHERPRQSEDEPAGHQPRVSVALVRLVQALARQAVRAFLAGRNMAEGHELPAATIPEDVKEDSDG